MTREIGVKPLTAVDRLRIRRILKETFVGEDEIYYMITLFFACMSGVQPDFNQIRESYSIRDALKHYPDAKIYFQDKLNVTSWAHVKNLTWDSLEEGDILYNAYNIPSVFTDGHLVPLTKTFEKYWEYWDE